MKNGKSAGLDNITNKYIKSSCTEYLPFYHTLFNTVFNSGVLPTSWLTGYIIPLYKTKEILLILKITDQLLVSVVWERFYLNDRLTSY